MNEALMMSMQKITDQINIVTNILRIPLIEIEQLNPRIHSIHGAMKVRYHNTGGDIDDPESTLMYEYEYIGGELDFVQNPFPRVPLGTGKIAHLADDYNDPHGKKIPVPKGALSGEDFGWNREFLASHYGEGYWRIVDPQIDAEIQDRYRQILENKFLDAEGKTDHKKVNAEIERAVSIQNGGVRSSQNVVVRTTSNPIEERMQIARKPTGVSIEEHPTFKAVMKQNEALTSTVEKLTEQMAEIMSSIDAKKKPAKTAKKSGPNKPEKEPDVKANEDPAKSAVSMADIIARKKASSQKAVMSGNLG